MSANRLEFLIRCVKPSYVKDYQTSVCDWLVRVWMIRIQFAAIFADIPRCW